MTGALVFDHVTKDYRGSHRYRALRDDLSALLRPRRGPRPAVRALDDINLEIAEGEAFGLVGPNGAGKTTALKLATRISYPTAGRIHVRGRVGALIEVGTGLHPELSGRENVTLYGRILGFSGAEIARRFDDVVEFAGIGGAIDQPVKQYSSGMTLRLGFSLAAHLEPDVLLVDEAIAVGDAAFQQQCMRKMGELARGGMTLVFVTHSMEAIEAICSRAVLLDRGTITADGAPRDVIKAYMRTVEQTLVEPAPFSADGTLTIERVTLHRASGEEVDEAEPGAPLTVRLHYVANDPLRHPHFNVSISDGRQQGLFSATMLYDGQCPELLHGHGALDCAFSSLPLRPRTYEIWAGVKSEDGVGQLFEWQLIRRFRVAGEADGPGKAGVARGATLPPISIPYEWRLHQGNGNGRG
jgi:ABC-type polysaccharide/polyol phosphate transport system ATPase subunit